MMRKRKIDVDSDVRRANDIYNDDIIRITKEGKEYFFEIGSEMTGDIAEAVTILMRKVDFNDKIWETPIRNIIYEDISPEKSLYWLTGGNTEWKGLENYNKQWCDCYLEFQEEFGTLIINLIKKSKNLADIRNSFIKYLNLPTLYDFAIRKNMIKII